MRAAILTAAIVAATLHLAASQVNAAPITWNFTGVQLPGFNTLPPGVTPVDGVSGSFTFDDGVTDALPLDSATGVYLSPSGPPYGFTIQAGSFSFRKTMQMRAIALNNSNFWCIPDQCDGFAIDNTINFQLYFSAYYVSPDDLSLVTSDALPHGYPGFEPVQNQNIRLSRRSSRPRSLRALDIAHASSPYSRTRLCVPAGHRLGGRWPAPMDPAAV